MNRRLLPLWLSLSACVEAGQARVEVPLFLAGTQLEAPLMTVGDVEVQLDRADLAFGPLYLCAGATAGELCDTARLEWLDAAVVDTLAPDAVQVGALTGVSGPVRSWMYDLGISSQLTRDEPFVLDAAAALGGASFVVEGRAEVGGAQLSFRASVPVRQTGDTELGVPVIRKSAAQRFEHELLAGERGLLLRFDARAWLQGVDLRPYAGQTEVTLAPDSEAYRSLRNALFVSGRPLFEWDFVP